jgi:DNA-directed RNA polymerase specialized sigma24 family protein
LVALARHSHNIAIELRPPAERVRTVPRAPARITQKTRDLIVELYEKGYTGREIADELGIVKSTVYANLRRAKVEVRPQYVKY